MILNKITGGSGNQFFQYAFSLYLALINNAKLVLNLSEFSVKKHRQFLLSRFNIKAEYASVNFLRSFLKFSYYFPYDFKPFIHKLFPDIFSNIIYEKQFTFSWWLGWLNSNRQKIVTVPKNWFNELKHDINDLIPQSWIRI